MMSYKNTFYIIKNKRFDIPYEFINLEKKDYSLECSICLENYENTECVKLDSCGHIYHEKCIRESLKFSKYCPLCRSDIYDIKYKCIII